MKYSGLLVLLCCLVAGAGCTQSRTIFKGYAYTRQTTGGAAPVGGVDENGKSQPAGSRASTEYLIFAQRYASDGLVVQRIWINGKNYAAVAERLNKTPVVLQGTTGSRQYTLVPKTNSKVWQLQLKGENPPVAEPAIARYAAQSGQVVIEYLSNKTVKYFTIPVITNLPPAPLQ